MWLLLGLLGIAGAADSTAPPQPAVRTERLADGSVRVVPDRQVPGPVNPAERITLEFTEITLYDLALYFADLTRTNLLLTDESALKGKSVRFVGHQDMSVDAAWQAFRSSLQGHGFALVEVGGGVMSVVARDVVVRGRTEVGTGPPGQGEAVVTRLLPVRNARARDLTAILAPLLSTQAQLVAYAPANTLIITDTANNVRKAYELVAELDVAAPESSLQLTRLTWASAGDVRAVLEALYPSEPTPSSSRNTGRTSRSRKGRRASEAKAASSSSGEDPKEIHRVLADERTNSLIVLANRQGHAEVARLVEELDIDVDPSARKNLKVVQLKYALAEEVAAVLQSLAAGTGRREAARPRGSDKDGADPLEVLDGELRFAPDPSTNAIAVVADPAEFAILSQLIEELDVARGQVFVDAVFVELTSSSGQETALGVHAITDAGTASLQTDPEGTFNSLAVSTELLSGLAAGVFGEVVDVVGLDGNTLSVPTFGIALQALQTHSDVQVMGNPALLTLDHQEARLQVGRRIPFSTSNQVTTVGTPVQTFERVDVATELKVTPHINTTSLVTLDLALVVDEVEGTGAESNLEGGPITSGRTVESRVMVESGSTVVIAGLVSTKAEQVKTKVPVLGDIPLLGLLFRGRTTATRDTHLLVFLTPYVLETPSDLLAIRQMKEAQRREFVRRFQGPPGQHWLAELDGLLSDARGRDEAARSPSTELRPAPPPTRRERRKARRRARREARQSS